MRQLTQAILPREIITPRGGRHLVEPPKLGTALALMSSKPGWDAGVSSHMRAWADALRTWLPLRLSSELLCTAVTSNAEHRQSVSRMVIALAWENVPEAERDQMQASEEDQERGYVYTRHGWTARVADLSRGFGMTPLEVLELPLPLALALLPELPAVQAQEDLRLMMTSALPHLSHGDRKALQDRLMTSAGFETPAQRWAAMTEMEQSQAGVEYLQSLLIDKGEHGRT